MIVATERLVFTMKIILSNEALLWFKQEMEVEPGDAIRFFARYGGSSSIQAGFSLGVTKEQPDEVAIETVLTVFATILKAETNGISLNMTYMLI